MYDSLESLNEKPYALIQNMKTGLVSVVHERDVTFLRKRFRENIADQVRNFGLVPRSKFKNWVVYVKDAINSDEQSSLDDFLKELSK